MSPRDFRSLASLMTRGALGPVAGAIPLFALPLAGAAYLTNDQFAVWAILSTVSTLALSLDFGGMSFLAANIHVSERTRVMRRASQLSATGSLAIGLLACTAWVPYSRTDAGQAFSLVEGVAALIAITLASALRSIVQLFAHAALTDRRFGMRNTLLVGHALLTGAITIGVLAIWPSPWALPAGWLCSGTLFAIVATVDRYPRRLPVPLQDGESYDAIAIPRTIATIASGIIMQADRWIIGALGGPTLLATYEIAWRVAVMPRFLSQNLTFVVGLDARRTLRDSLDDLIDYFRKSVLLSGMTTLAAGALGSAFYVLAAPHVGYQVSWTLFLSLLVAQSLFGLAASVSFIGNGLGDPWIDIPYLLACVCMGIFALVAALFSRVPDVFVYGNLAGISIASVWLLSAGQDKITRAALGRPARANPGAVT